jgi:methylase of polypeptide subunit release factors
MQLKYYDHTSAISYFKYVPNGRVTGTDLSDDVLKQAQETLVANVVMEKGNVVDGL